jgi:hypothetical protein
MDGNFAVWSAITESGASDVWRKIIINELSQVFEQMA